jgi:GNAT superfamily N-acetyltransferase
MTVRPARPADADAVFELAVELATSFVPERASFDRAYADVLGDEQCRLLVGEDEQGRVVGYLLAFVHPTFFANGPVGWIEELMVRPDARRGGLGRSLVAHAEQWTVEHAASLVALATRRADAFWQAVGYEPSATYLRKVLVAAG